MKSANVLVKNENGDCVIGDLGFAMILDPSLDSKQLASTGQVICVLTSCSPVLYTYSMQYRNPPDEGLRHNDVIQ